MKTILQVNTHSGFGGGERVMFDIVQALRNDFSFIVLSPSGVFLEKYAEIGIPVRELPEVNFLKKVIVIRKIVKRDKLDIVHVHGTRAASWVRLAVIGLKEKPQIVYTLHGFHIIRKRFFLKWPLILLERFLNLWTDILICVGDNDKSLVLRYKTISKEKTKVIKNGIDIEKFRINSELVNAARERLKLEEKFVLITIGRLHPPKDFSTILRALKTIVPQTKNIKLLVVGDGPLRGALEREKCSLNLQEYVEFLGWRKDIPLLINISDVFILSTQWEGLPLVPLEAAAAGKSVVVSNVDGARDIVIDGKTGFLFQFGSEKDLADKILKLMQTKELRKTMGESGFSFVTENFSKQRMVEEYKNLYQSML